MSAHLSGLNYALSYININVNQVSVTHGQCCKYDRDMLLHTLSAPQSTCTAVQQQQQQQLPVIQ
jgi:hypothetical protein